MKWKRARLGWWGLGSALVLSFLLLVSHARRSVQESACRGKLFFLGVHVLQYELAHNATPPPTANDATARPTRSWRTVLHARMNPDFAGRYNFDEPWDSPNNMRAAVETPSYFVCDNNRWAHGGFGGFANYAAVVDGPLGALKPFNLDLSNEEATILLVEIPDSDIFWTEPRDISPSELATLPEGNDPGGLGVVLTNGRAVRLSRQAILERLERGGK